MSTATTAPSAISSIRGRIWLFGDDLNTDVIHPPQFFSLDPEKVKRGLFHGLDPTIQPNLQPGDILVGGRNFGCGSSREHAPWALEDWGFRVIIAPSFADIFYNNCFKNGMLPIALSEAQVDDLFKRAAEHSPYELTADLHTCMLTDNYGLSLKIDVEPFRQKCLLNGLDDIGLTLEHEDKIAAFERSHAVAG